jgi:hypothetical protein
MSVWKASSLTTGPATDGGKCKIPTLRVKHDRTGAVLCEAIANSEKSAWLFKEFFSKKPAASTVPPNFVYPDPAWEYQPIMEDVLHQVI